MVESTLYSFFHKIVQAAALWGGGDKLAETNTHPDPSNGNARFRVQGRSNDSIVYNSWIAESFREVKRTNGIGPFQWETWETRGDPIPILVEFQDGSGQPIASPPPESGDGWISFTHWSFGTSAVHRIASMRIAYTWEGKTEEIVVGRDWITPLIIAVVVVVLLILIFGVLGLIAVA